MPDSSSSEHANFVACTPAVKTAYLKTGCHPDSGSLASVAEDSESGCEKGFSRYSLVHVLGGTYRPGMRPEPRLRRL